MRVEGSLTVVVTLRGKQVRLDSTQPKFPTTSIIQDVVHDGTFLGLHGRPRSVPAILFVSSDPFFEKRLVQSWFIFDVALGPLCFVPIFRQII